MTLEELDRLPADFNRYELMEAELYVTPAPRTRHQIVSGRLFELLSARARKGKLGLALAAPTDVTLEPTTRVQPDLLFIAQHRLDIVAESGILGPPDLVVEILSESTHWTDRHDKLGVYRRSGVKEYWIIDVDDKSVLIHRFAESTEPQKLVISDVLTTPLLPGLRIRLRSIFAK